MVSDDELRWCIEQLGILDSDFVKLRKTRSNVVAQRLLDAIKLKTKQQFRRLSLEYHPDRTQGDEARTARFRQLSEVYRDIQALELPPRVKASPVEGPYRFTASTRSGIIRVTLRSRE